ncbi:MAG: GNAT family N-acetyltransferase [Candidatus Saccharibacteria bacterium]|nr:GNAT family N-acetyltransferase [Candidatus Saccharibacteria bacterium]
MEYEIKKFSDLEYAMQNDVANKVAAYTNGELGEIPQMLPVQPEDVFKKFVGFVALHETTFAGFVGSADPIEWAGLLMPEVGSLWVPKEFRNHGVANSLVRTISDYLLGEGLQPFAFVNPKSNSIFNRNGYLDAVNGEIPDSAFGLCKGCKHKPANGCCDRVVIYTGAKG